METKYTSERNTQILISLMKSHGVRKIVVSPGATNVSFVASVQTDPFFELFSAVDERSAAYMACGLAAETGEAVALSCTGATASRNYMPALTEAFYRKLPVLAITSTQSVTRIGHYVAQVIDRTVVPNDVAKYSLQLPTVRSAEDEWAAVIGVNRALLELFHHGTGPVHINLATTYSNDFSVNELPVFPKIERFDNRSQLPPLKVGKVAVFVGAHEAFSKELTQAIDRFCSCHNAIVLCDQTSNYRGKYRVLGNILTNQSADEGLSTFDVMIHIGSISGAYMSLSPKTVWRIDPDGEIRDPFKKLQFVFEMNEVEFFEHYATGESLSDGLLSLCRENERRIRAKIPELPFSNIWVASQTAGKLPCGSVLHLGILNTLRSWNFFDTPESVRVYANTGGFGIDGCLSTLIGASLAQPDTLYFGVMGDLAFFYDMNALGNRYLAPNVRIMIINNGIGTEFKNYNHRVAAFGDSADAYMAAGGHFGQKSPALIRDYAQDLGCKYLCASNKEEYLSAMQEWITPEKQEQPIVFELFTQDSDESRSLFLMNHIEETRLRGIVRRVFGEKGVKWLKRILKRS